MASGGEPGAPLVAAGFEDRSAGAGLHPSPEAMLAFTAANIRLVRTLGHWVSLPILLGPPDLVARQCREIIGALRRLREYSGGAFPHVERRSRRNLCVLPAIGLSGGATVDYDAPRSDPSAPSGGQDCGTSPMFRLSYAPLTGGCPQVWIRLLTGAKCLLRPAFLPNAIILDALPEDGVSDRVGSHPVDSRVGKGGSWIVLTMS